jgi:hypothetical protein
MSKFQKMGSKEEGMGNNKNNTYRKKEKRQEIVLYKFTTPILCDTYGTV